MYAHDGISAGPSQCHLLHPLKYQMDDLNALAINENKKRLLDLHYPITTSMLFDLLLYCT